MSHTQEIAGPSGLQNESENNNNDQIRINDDGDHSYCIPAGTPTISFNFKAREQRSASLLGNQRQEMIEQIGNFNDRYVDQQQFSRNMNQNSRSNQYFPHDIGIRRPCSPRRRPREDSHRFPGHKTRRPDSFDGKSMTWTEYLTHFSLISR